MLPDHCSLRLHLRCAMMVGHVRRGPPLTPARVAVLVRSCLGVLSVEIRGGPALSTKGCRGRPVFVIVPGRFACSGCVLHIIHNLAFPLVFVGNASICGGLGLDNPLSLVASSRCAARACPITFFCLSDVTPLAVVNGGYLMKNVLRNPLAVRVIVLFLSALGGWAIAQFPGEVAAFCGVSNVPLR